MPEADGFDFEKPARQIAKGAVSGALSGIGDWFKSWWSGKSETIEPGRSVLVIGPNGVGKTTLARLLSGQSTLLDSDVGDYDESLAVEAFQLADDAGTELIVAPGQEYRRPTEWPELKSQLASGVYRGVILVSAYGYHAFNTPSYKNHTLYKGAVDQFRTDYFANRREKELRVLGELLPHLAVCPQKCWLLSLVTKEDLWEKQRTDVEEHYRRGPYARAVADGTAARGTRFWHELVFVSLVIRNLKTPNDETLANTVSGYDQPRQVASLRALIRALAALRAWEDAT